MRVIYLSATLVVSLFALAASAFSAPPTLNNYYSVIQGIQGKLDRDWRQLNPQGEPAPGAIATIETILKVINKLGIHGPGNYQIFTPEDGSPSCSVASATCSEMKILVRNSAHHADSTLFDVPTAFQWDIVVWGSRGFGYGRFLEGYYSPVSGTAGKGNFTLISCGGCSTVGHSQIEWDASQAIYHLRAKLYDTRVMSGGPGPDVYAGMIIDAFYSPISGDLKLSAAANNVCDSGGIGDSICSNGMANDFSAGYAALVHGNTLTGNVYVQGVQGANNSVVTPSADPMCIKADKTADMNVASVCSSDGIDNFSGLSAYSPSHAPVSFVASGNPWPMSDINDSPTF